MRAFAALCQTLDAADSEGARLRAWQRYLRLAAPEDAAWALHLLLGQRPRRMASAADLRATALQLTSMDAYLLDACLQRSGDLAETLALVLPPPREPVDRGLAEWMCEQLLPLAAVPAAQRAAIWHGWLGGLQAPERWVLLQLLSGNFRLRPAATTLQDGLAQAAGLTRASIALRLQQWLEPGHRPDAAAWASLLAPMQAPTADLGQPHPFTKLELLPASGPGSALGTPGDWVLTWHMGGLPAQLVRRGGRSWLWLSGPELVNQRHPDLVALSDWLPEGSVLEGELQPLPADSAYSARFVALDLLELGGASLHAQPLHQRQAQLATLWCAAPASGPFARSETCQASDGPALAALHARGRSVAAAGLLLRHRLATRLPAPAGPADHWLWPLAPWRLQGVLIHAQLGTDGGSAPASYSFALWNRPPRDEAEVARALAAGVPPASAPAEGLHLVPFAKVPAPADAEQAAALAACIQATTVAKFGPVRALRPSLACTIAFDQLRPSRRHRCGFAVLLPRIETLHVAGQLHEAGHLAQLLALERPCAPTP